jgi:hypothetical protein
MTLPKNKLTVHRLVYDRVAVQFASTENALVFNGVTYLPSDELAWFQYIMCHSLPDFNAHRYGMTIPTLVRSAASARDQLLNFRHLIVDNDAKLTEDRIIGHIKDIYVPTAEWIEKGLITADYRPMDKLAEGMPVYALGCLYKRAKGMDRVIAEHLASGGRWATSMECNFLWPNAGVFVDGKITPLLDAPVELAEAVLPNPVTGEPATYSYQGKKVYLVGGGEDGEVSFVGGALTMYPADSKANILKMVAEYKDEPPKTKKVFYTRGGESIMDFVEMLRALKGSLDELSSTDGFQAFKDASAKVNDAKNALFSVMDKCSSMISSMAEDKAKAMLAEGYVSKADHEKTLAEASMAASEVAVAAAKKEWDATLAEEKRIADVFAGRMTKLAEAKIAVPETLKTKIATIKADAEGDTTFTTILSRLETRKKAVTDAKVELSEIVMGRILATLADEDAVFTAELDVWKALIAPPKGKEKASVDAAPFVPPQAGGAAGDPVIAV